eukprot:jgi/Psemu1/287114/fgenesh1_pg.175_\
MTSNPLFQVEQREQNCNRRQYRSFAQDLAICNSSVRKRLPPISINRGNPININHYIAASSSSLFFSSQALTNEEHNTKNKDTNDTGTSQSPSSLSDEKFKVLKIETATGKVETIHMDQSAIMRQTTLSPRDLVSLRLTSKKERREAWVGNTLVEQMRHPPTITAREKLILLSVGPVRAVAEPKAVYIFDVHSKAAKLFADDLSKLYQHRSERIESNVQLHQEEPAELVFLEAVLMDTLDSFTGRICIFEPIVNDLLLRISDLEDFANSNTIHQMAPLKEQLQSFEIFVTQAYECVTELLNDDEAMLQLLLTEKEEARQSNTTVDFQRHQHVEHILGIYARRFNSVIQEANYLLGRIESQQQYVELELDLYRNRLIRMNLDLAILATATGITTAFSGFFGMNMVNGYEESHTAFLVVSAASAVTAVTVATFFRRMVSRNVIQQRAEQRMGEIRTMSNALSDMSALDYTVKKMIRGERMDKDEFKEQLTTARHSKKCTDNEIELLFNVLNTQKNDVLDRDDFMNGDEVDDDSTSHRIC